VLVYIISSLKNKRVIDVANALEQHGVTPFTDWFCSGPDADDHLRDTYKARGKSYIDAMASPAVENIWQFDKLWLDRSDAAVLVMPCGKSGHLELGYAIGKGKPAYILFDEAPERIDVMHRYATGLCFSMEALIEVLNDLKVRG
jgi:hypothetical protein